MLILASQSPIRRQMLAAAGIAFETRPADIDEAALRDAAVDQHLSSLAQMLAQAKALAVPADTEDDVIIGSDSIAACDGRRFDKPQGRDDAAAHLAFFSGRTIELHSHVALARGGEIVWSAGDVAHLDVRALSDDFINAYLDAEWPAVAYCVGVFRFEGRGVQLFDAVRGSHFTIQGMPMIKLLAGLRQQGILAS